jgi:hypothetical protein
VTVVNPDGTGANGLPVTIDGRRVNGCGQGCYAASASRQPTVVVDGHTLHFAVPKLRSAAAVVARAKRAYDTSPALTIRERLATRPGLAQVTLYHERAPDRLAYRIVSSSVPSVVGEDVVVIGGTRWQRPRGGRWVRSPEGTVNVPRTYWVAARNAYFANGGEVTFYDPLQRAWFRMRLDSAGRPVELWMTGAAHFMYHDYSFRSPPVSAPVR